KSSVLTSDGDLPLLHKVHNEDHWLDADNLEIHTTVTDHQGADVLTQTKKMRRITTDAVVGPKAPPDPKRPAPFALFDRAAGVWTTTANVTLAELGGQKVRSQATTQDHLILAGRFLESRERMQPGNRDDYIIFGYDENRKVYRFWHFAAGGDVTEAD